MTTVFNFVNDLHLDFYAQYDTNPVKLKRNVDAYVQTLLNNTEEKGDVLVVAGDFGHDNQTSQLFLEAVSPLYDHVFATVGNHDMYLISKNTQKKFNKNSYKRVQDLVNRTSHVDNLTWLLDHKVHDFRGVKLAGHTMMAAPESPEELLFYHQSMNDSRFIFLPDSLDDFNQAGLDGYCALPDDLDLFVSHYPLVQTPVFRNDASQGSYYNFVPELKAKHYMFGHVHQRDDFTKENSQFHTHAVGYPDEGFTPSFGVLKL